VFDTAIDLPGAGGFSFRMDQQKWPAGHDAIDLGDLNKVIFCFRGTEGLGVRLLLKPANGKFVNLVVQCRRRTGEATGKSLQTVAAAGVGAKVLRVKALGGQGRVMHTIVVLQFHGRTATVQKANGDLAALLQVHPEVGFAYWEEKIAPFFSGLSDLYEFCEA
jgi:hypothetical protein